jgi:hypothetical protein
MPLRYSIHAQQEFLRDRYNSKQDAVLPDSHTIAQTEVVEMEIIGGWAKKIVIRFSLDAHRDWVMALIPREDGWMVKTVWINLKSDKHRTLDRSRYLTFRS